MKTYGLPHLELVQDESWGVYGQPVTFDYFTAHRPDGSALHHRRGHSSCCENAGTLWVAVTITTESYIAIEKYKFDPDQ